MAEKLKFDILGELQRVPDAKHLHLRRRLRASSETRHGTASRHGPEGGACPKAATRQSGTCSIQQLHGVMWGAYNTPFRDVHADFREGGREDFKVGKVDGVNEDLIAQLNHQVLVCGIARVQQVRVPAVIQHGRRVLGLGVAANDLATRDISAKPRGLVRHRDSSAKTGVALRLLRIVD